MNDIFTGWNQLNNLAPYRYFLKYLANSGQKNVPLTKQSETSEFAPAHNLLPLYTMIMTSSNNS